MIYPFPSLSLPLRLSLPRLRVFDCHVYMPPFCPPLDIRGIKIGCHYSLTQFFFNLSPLVAVCVILTYLSTCVCVHIHQSSKPLRTRAVSSSRSISATRLRCVFPSSFSSFRVPEADTSLGTKGIRRHSCEFQFIRVRFASSSQMMRGRALLTTMTARLMKRSACA